jgi:AhpD family alkylhydroperoxidase
LSILLALRIPQAKNSRLTKEEKMVVEAAELTGAPGPSFYNVLAHKPEIMKGYAKLWNSAFYDGEVDHKLKELVRISIVNTFACGYCSTVRSNVARKMGLTEEKIRDLDHFETSPLFTQKERAAIKYGKIFATDINVAKDDKVYSDFRQYFSDSEAVELESLIALTEGFGKLVSTWGLIPASCDVPTQMIKTS